MNLKIYKTTTQYSINYSIIDSDQPNYTGIFITWKRDQSTFNIGTQCGQHYNLKDKVETSFLDLLAVTGITKDQVEYIFRNIDFEKYELSITPRHTIHLHGGGLSGVTGCSGATACSTPWSNVRSWGGNKITP